MASLNDIETKVHHIIDILDARTIKTITGVLPLTFTAKGGTAVDWVISGNAQGVGERTENLFDKNSYSATGKNLVYTGEENAANAWSISEYIEVTSNTTFTLANVVGGSPSLCWYNNNKEYLSGEKYNNRTTITVTSPMNAAYIRISVVTDTENPYYNENTIMLVKGSTAPSTYVPYGYEIPISVNGTPQTFYIGNTPLRAGQSISKTSTGVDIATTEGENTISTTLYNKPEMTIKYKY